MSKESTVKASMALPDIAGLIDYNLEAVAGERMGFALFVFPFNELGRASYISNSSRDELIENITKWIDRQNEGMPDVPAHQIN